MSRKVSGRSRSRNAWPTHMPMQATARAPIEAGPSDRFRAETDARLRSVLLAD